MMGVLQGFGSLHVASAVSFARPSSEDTSLASACYAFDDCNDPFQSYVLTSEIIFAPSVKQAPCSKGDNSIGPFLLPILHNPVQIALETLSY